MAAARDRPTSTTRCRRCLRHRPSARAGRLAQSERPPSRERRPRDGDDDPAVENGLLRRATKGARDHGRKVHGRRLRTRPQGAQPDRPRRSSATSDDAGRRQAAVVPAARQRGARRALIHRRRRVRRGGAPSARVRDRAAARRPRDGPDQPRDVRRRHRPVPVGRAGGRRLLVGVDERSRHGARRQPPRVLDPPRLDRRPPSGADARDVRARELVPEPGADGEDGDHAPGAEWRPADLRHRRGLARGGVPRLRLGLPLDPRADRAARGGDAPDEGALDAGRADRLRGALVPARRRTRRPAPGPGTADHDRGRRGEVPAPRRGEVRGLVVLVRLVGGGAGAKDRDTSCPLRGRGARPGRDQDGGSADGLPRGDDG